MKHLAPDQYQEITTFMGEQRHAFEAMTRWNYFPNQKESASELPRIVSTRKFTPEVAIKLAAASRLRERWVQGYDLVEYRATRYNNVPRVLGLIHPSAYARLTTILDAHWDDLRELRDNDRSVIKPQAHTDGRLFIMNYEDHSNRAEREIDQGFGLNFVAHTDVANCFGSIYTHGLEWALQGHEQAKKNLASKGALKHWSSELDRAYRHTKRNETLGLAIGPATSNIAAEILLGAVDKKMKSAGYQYVRYVDDYSCLAAKFDDAQAFIRDLGKNLADFKMALNLGKTEIHELPVPTQATWIFVLMQGLPHHWREDRSGIRELDVSEAIRFLDHAVALNKQTPDGSVIKYAVSTICSRVTGRCAKVVFGYVLNLAWHYPILLPYLEKISTDEWQFDAEEVLEKLKRVVLVNALHRRSDGMAWGLYYIGLLKASPGREVIEAIIRSGDCVSIAILGDFPEAIPYVSDFSLKLCGLHFYERDKYWLLLYQLFYRGVIGNVCGDEECFDLLRRHEVDFIHADAHKTKAEKYCDLVNNPFLNADEKVPSFDDWLSNE